MNEKERSRITKSYVRAQSLFATEDDTVAEGEEDNEEENEEDDDYA